MIELIIKVTCFVGGIFMLFKSNSAADANNYAEAAYYMAFAVFLVK